MKDAALKLFLLALSLAVGLSAVEFVLKEKNLPRFYLAHSREGQFDFRENDKGEFRYRNAPSKEIVFVYDGDRIDYAITHTTNSAGFRGREFLHTKGANTVRIAFLGDSFTFGEGVRDGRTFAERTSQYLNKSVSPEKSVRFESYNFGVGGYNTTQSLQLLREEVLGWDPDIVVLGFTLNDAEPMLFTVDDTTGEPVRRERENRVSEGLPDPLPPDTFLFRFRLPRLIWQIARTRKITGQTIDYYRGLYEDGSAGWLEAKKSLVAILDICVERRIPCYVLCFPILFHLDESYPFESIHRKIGRVVEEAGGDNAVFIDLLPLFRGTEDRSLWVHPTDQHPNEKAHDMVARELARIIGKDRGIGSCN